MGILANQTQRANFEFQVLPSGALTVSGNTGDFENLYGLGAHFFFNITAVAGTTPTIQFSIDEKDPLSGQYSSILKSAAMNPPVAGLTRLAIYPGLVAAANAV